MAFHFDRHEPVAVGIQRLLHERLDGSIQHFSECVHPTDPVHIVRKDIKKARAILTLVRSHLACKAYRREAKTLRNISSVLARVRDTQVHLQTLKDLTTHFKIRANHDSFAAVGSILEQEQDRAQNDFSVGRGNRRALKLLRSAKGRIADLGTGNLEDDWRTLSSGFLETYKRGKKGLLIAQKNGHPEEFHEWRKTVKRLWYQMRLISPAWPAMIEALSDELSRLGEGLGAHHDLFALRTIIDQQPASVISEKQRKHLVSLITKRQSELRREALSLGERIYGEKPVQFCKRIGLYWNTWHAHHG